MVEPRPLLGYAMVLSAATLWAVNGTVSKAILSSGLSSLRLAEVRSAGAVVGLGLVLALTRPESLRVTRNELPFLAVFGSSASGSSSSSTSSPSTGSTSGSRC